MEEEAGRGHMPLNGFADNKVISDARFRLATALRQVCGEKNHHFSLSISLFLYLSVYLSLLYIASAFDYAWSWR